MDAGKEAVRTAVAKAVLSLAAEGVTQVNVSYM